MKEVFGIKLNEFNLSQSQFDNDSSLHGYMHSYRVMLHVLRLGLITGQENAARLAFFAAYIHDMARKHDGYCTVHGAEAANLKLPLYKEKFLNNGATVSDLLTIGRATALHSTATEAAHNDKDYYTIAILKDADALDRIRLGEDDLNPDFLRLEQTHGQILFAKDLFYQSLNVKIISFEDIIAIGGLDLIS